MLKILLSSTWSPNNTQWSVQIMKLLILRFTPLFVTPPLLAPDTSLNTLLSNNFTLQFKVQYCLCNETRLIINK
jgi:hypothetical protein